MSDRVGLYPGSFDPVTFGQIDLIRRSLHVVDRLVVAILPNATKEALLTLAEREALLRSVILFLVKRGEGSLSLQEWRRGGLILYQG